MRVVMHGCMGVGKSYVGRVLAEKLNCTFHHEPFELNPYIERTYVDAKWSIYAQIQQLLLCEQQSQEVGVLDGSIWGVRAFSRVYLQDDEDMQLFDNIYRRVSKAIPPPDILVYLKCPTSFIVERINSRGRAMETNVTPSFIGALNQQMSKTYAHYQGRKIALDYSRFSQLTEVVDTVVEQLYRKQQTV